MATTVFSPGSYTVSGISPAQTGIAESFQAGLQANLTRREAQQRLRANEQLMQMRRAQEERTKAEYEESQRRLAEERAASTQLMRGLGGIENVPATGVTTAGAIAPIAPTTPILPSTSRAGLTPPPTGIAAPTPAAAPTADLRPDGTPKGKGFLGELQIRMPDGLTAVATEYSIGVNIDGTETLIPSLVPTLTPEQQRRMVEDIIPNGKPVPPDIVKAAVDHARARIRSGVSPFATAPPTGVAAAATPAATIPQRNDPVLISARLDEIEEALAADTGRTRDPERLENRSRLKAERDALRDTLENVIAQDPEIIALNAQLERLGTSRSAVAKRREIIAKRDALAQRLSGLSASELEQRRTGTVSPWLQQFMVTDAAEPTSPEAAKAEAPTTAEEAAPVIDTTYGGLQPNYGSPVQLSFGAAETEGEASGLYVDAPERIFQDIDTLSRQQQRLQALATYYQQTNNVESLVGIINQIEVLNIEQRYLDGMVAIAGIQQENFGPVQVLLQQRFPGRQVEVRPYTDGTVEIFLDGESEARITWDDLATNLRTVYDKGFIAEQQAKAKEIAERSRFVFETETKELFQGQREISVAGVQAGLDMAKARNQAEIDTLIQNGSIELIGTNTTGESVFQTYMNGVPVQFVYRQVETRDPVTGDKTTMLSPEPLMLPSVQ